MQGAGTAVRGSLRRRRLGALALMFVGSLSLAHAETETPPPAAAPAATDAPPVVVEIKPPAVPPAPSDARAAKAYAVFDTYCASCHQTGKLKIPAAARPLADILDLDDVATREALVKPGLPDASPLYTIFWRQHAGIDLESLPTTAEIQSVRDWIAELPPLSANCGRAKTTAIEVEQAIAENLADADEAKRKDLRFVTLTHLADACVSSEHLAGYRQAVAKVVNTLSWGPEPIKLETLGPHDTILRLDLSQLGWVAAHWDRIIQAYPYAAHASSRLSENVRRLTAAANPAIRADWFAHAAIGTSLYANLLGLPGRLANLQRILNVDIEADIRSTKARRAGVTQSNVMRANRLVERHPTRNGSLWLAYDFANSEGRQNVLTHPLGPTANSVVKVPFKHDELRALFTLPNGFVAYSLNDTRGDRIDAAPEQLERDTLSWAFAGGGVAACMSCHSQGPIKVSDAVRPHFEADATAPADVKERVLALFPPSAEIDQLVAEDQARYIAALQKAGIDPALQIGGMEPVAALAAEYTRDVGLHRLAAEAGLAPADAKARLHALPEELQLSARRVLMTAATRAEADRLLARLAPDAGSSQATVVVAAAPADARDTHELVLWTQQQTYDVGQLATFHARTNQNCYLTLISLDRSGQATVLFPNEFQQDNLLTAGKELTLPGEKASYQFRLREKGSETLVGICQTAVKTPEGIQHDFERQRFSMLGDWRSFLAQLPAPAPRHAAAPAAAGEPPKARPARNRGRAATTEPKTAPATPPPAPAAPAPDVQMRAAISYEIR